MTHFVQLVDGSPLSHRQPPAGMEMAATATGRLLPPIITSLHESLYRWQQAGLDPGPLTPDRIWIDSAGALALAFKRDQNPEPLGHVGLAPALAGWLVCLDKWMETFVVIARARSVWTPTELAGALTFTTPALLPPPLLQLPPVDNWERVARGLAVAVADGPLQGTPSNRHWEGR